MINEIEKEVRTRRESTRESRLVNSVESLLRTEKKKKLDLTQEMAGYRLNKMIHGSLNKLNGSLNQLNRNLTILNSNTVKQKLSYSKDFDKSIKSAVTVTPEPSKTDEESKKLLTDIKGLLVKESERAPEEKKEDKKSLLDSFKGIIGGVLSNPAIGMAGLIGAGGAVLLTLLQKFFGPQISKFFDGLAEGIGWFKNTVGNFLKSTEDLIKTARWPRIWPFDGGLIFGSTSTKVADKKQIEQSKLEEKTFGVQMKNPSKDKVSDLTDPAARLALKKLSDVTDRKLVITSIYRDLKEQEALWNKITAMEGTVIKNNTAYNKKWMVARPGTSGHEKGSKLDIRNPFGESQTEKLLSDKFIEDAKRFGFSVRTETGPNGERLLDLKWEGKPKTTIETPKFLMNPSLLPKEQNSINWQLPKLALGGITSGPTVAQIGEAGREAVIPLESRSGIGALTEAMAKYSNKDLSVSLLGRILEVMLRPDVTGLLTEIRNNLNNSDTQFSFSGFNNMNGITA